MSGECDRCGNHCLECMCEWRNSEVGCEIVEFEIMEADEEGWSEWIHPLPGYKMQCCDCGLVHEMETAIVKSHEATTPTAEGEDAEHIIVFRMRREF
jgi:hypothetical protein